MCSCAQCARQVGERVGSHALGEDHRQRRVLHPRFNGYRACCAFREAESVFWHRVSPSEAQQMSLGRQTKRVNIRKRERNDQVKCERWLGYRYEMYRYEQQFISFALWSLLTRITEMRIRAGRENTPDDVAAV